MNYAEFDVYEKGKPGLFPRGLNNCFYYEEVSRYECFEKVFQK